MPDAVYRYTESSVLELVITSRAARHYPWHVHTRHWTIGMVCAGSATLDTRAARCELHSGEHFVVRPFEAHSLAVTPDSVLAVLCLDFERDAARILNDTPATDSAANAEIGIFRTSDMPEPCSPNCFATLKELGLRLAAGQRPENNGLPDSPALVMARLLAAHPEDAASISRLAEFAGYSPWHFLRCFKKELGMTPHAFQLACRMRRLRTLLRKNAATAEAAASLGFADQSHMHKVFKRHHGLTPRQFQKASIRLES